MLWARVWVDELCRLDLAGVVISPGSRSTPLAIAFAEQKDLPVYVLHDERSAGFFGLGLGLSKNRPAVLLCTSGTAAANYFPAIVEANQAQVPLLILTADRPSELRASGANQTIDQVKLYGDQVRWYVDAGQPEVAPSANRLRSLRTLADRAVACTLYPYPGPVQVNFPFDKPLEPVSVPSDLPDDYWTANQKLILGRPDRAPFVQIEVGKLLPEQSTINSLAARIQAARRGLLICGPRSGAPGFAEAVCALAEQTGFPLLADALSDVRFAPHLGSDGVLGHYEAFLESCKFDEKPDLVLQFGGEPVSRGLLNYLAELDAGQRVLVSQHGAWADEAQALGSMLWTDPTELCRALLGWVGEPDEARAEWRGKWMRCENLARQVKAEVISTESFEGARVAELSATLAPGAILFVGSSLPIRHVDEFVGPNGQGWRVFANRGASGIDGTLSTALGVAAGLGEPIIVLLGDVALLHDLTALRIIRAFELLAKVVVINNDGGGIFQRLPISTYGPAFAELFTTPHGLTFESAAEQFRLAYAHITDDKSLETALQTKESALIEVAGDARQHEEIRQKIRMHMRAGVLGTKSK